MNVVKRIRFSKKTSLKVENHQAGGMRIFPGPVVPLFYLSILHNGPE